MLLTAAPTPPLDCTSDLSLSSNAARVHMVRRTSVRIARSSTDAASANVSAHDLGRASAALPGCASLPLLASDSLSLKASRTKPNRRSWHDAAMTAAEPLCPCTRSKMSRYSSVADRAEKSSAAIPMLASSLRSGASDQADSDERTSCVSTGSSGGSRLSSSDRVVVVRIECSDLHAEGSTSAPRSDTCCCCGGFDVMRRACGGGSFTPMGISSTIATATLGGGMGVFSDDTDGVSAPCENDPRSVTTRSCSSDSGSESSSVSCSRVDSNSDPDFCSVSGSCSTVSSGPIQLGTSCFDS
mmetsp:Transcript_42754/g.129930  ORF Transcript_42754/g.129930 Transcript_42754/m.129930 type:complete len:299 (+) Transcript_42754:3567-4463(+)